ncbi:MAG: site-specific integrase [Lachnospiraceae bacterium]|nr:site-specific integrase [Lachnospiraceae bacterium]
MAEAQKLPSGKWRCLAYLGKSKDGKIIRKSFTARLKSDAEKMAKDYEDNYKEGISDIDALDLTVETICQRYINKMTVKMEKGTKSPSTIKGYNAVHSNHIVGSTIGAVTLRKLKRDHIKKWIEDLEDSDLSVKSIKNIYGFLHSALCEYMPVIKLWNIKIENNEPKKEVYSPTNADIEKILDYFEENDHDMYVASLLAAYGTLRRSEVCALTAADVDQENNTIHVCKACVTDGNKWYPESKTKTKGSDRKIIMPAFVIAELPKQGNVVPLPPSIVTDRFARARKILGIEQIRFHDLRHYSASIMHALGIPDRYIMAKGGWTEEKTLHNHYEGTMTDYEEIMNKKANDFFTERHNKRHIKSVNGKSTAHIVHINERKASTMQ